MYNIYKNSKLLGIFLNFMKELKKGRFTFSGCFPWVYVFKIRFGFKIWTAQLCCNSVALSAPTSDNGNVVHMLFRVHT